MDLSILDELDAAEQELEQKRREARSTVLAEIQKLIDRIDARPEELTFKAAPKSARSSRRRSSRRTGTETLGTGSAEGAFIQKAPHLHQHPGGGGHSPAFPWRHLPRAMTETVNRSGRPLSPGSSMHTRNG